MIKKLGFIKKIKFIHVLLIVLILIVFFGLFKTEIKKWNALYSPAIRLRTIESNFACKIDVANPAYIEEKDRILAECYRETHKIVQCVTTARNIKIPQYIKKDSTCTHTDYEMWFSGFGINFFKTRDAKYVNGIFR